MTNVFQDYLALNRERVVRDFLLFYLFFLLAVVSASDFASVVIWVGPIVVLGIAIVVILSFHLLAAYLIVWTAARKNRLPLSEYIGSAEYEATGKELLKR